MCSLVRKHTFWHDVLDLMGIVIMLVEGRGLELLPVWRLAVYTLTFKVEERTPRYFSANDMLGR